MRQDPENSRAYLGKLMAVLKVHNINELSRVTSPLGEQILFKHALEFADDKLKLTLQKCIEINTEHISHLEALRQKEKEKKELEDAEQKYQEAMNAKTEDENAPTIIFISIILIIFFLVPFLLMR